ncbi:cytochrome P450 [Irpex rosettiformis]|uniref:Cytochrome P450 n=1 Tax=Irpex rosettiformis TaxID=378272 RepID=A0ACB8U0W2_9APHY|nr:cytochrome P450 [Irpex rosettiformis]
MLGANLLLPRSLPLRGDHREGIIVVIDNTTDVSYHTSSKAQRTRSSQSIGGFLRITCIHSVLTSVPSYSPSCSPLIIAMEGQANVLDPSLMPLIVCATFFFGLYVYFRRQGKAPLLPGPFSLPVIGNLFHYPPEYPWYKFTEWKCQFGDMFRLHGLGNEIVVLNSLDSINDLLVKQGHLYAHRPVFTLATELMGSSRSMAMMSNTKTWQLHRKLAHTAFSQESVKKYMPIQENIATLMSLAFLADPEHFIDHVRLATGRIIMSVTILKWDAQYIDQAEATQVVFTEVARPGASIIDIIPFCESPSRGIFYYEPLNYDSVKYLPESTPFFTFHAQAKMGRAMIHEMTSEKSPPPSFVSDLLSWSEDLYPDRKTFEEAVTWVAGAMYGGGVDTTYSVVLNAILAMMQYPEVQRTAQAELDRIIGDRLPTIADRESTPYLNALIKEAMRWYPPVPLGLAHRSAEDVIYKGFLIPKDAIVVPNVWAVSRVCAPEFPPERFIPERFLQPNYDEIDPNSYIFGFGRRVCPGRYLAGNSTYILIATVVHLFDFKPPRDTAGKELSIDPTWKASLTR